MYLSDNQCSKSLLNILPQNQIYLIKDKEGEEIFNIFQKIKKKIKG